MPLGGGEGGNHQNDDVIYELVLSELPCNLSTCKHSWNTLKDPYNTNNWGCRGSWSWSRSPAVGRWSRDPLFLGSIWTQIWTWLDSNPVFGFYGVEIFIKYAGILFTYYIIILGGGGGSRAMMILMTQGGWGVQNWPKVDDVIYGRSLSLKQVLDSHWSF